VALFKGNVGGVHLKVKFGLGGDTLGTLCISLGFLLFPNIKNFIVKLIKNLCEVLKTIMKLNLMDQSL
jgi:hypothetical protein